MSVLSKRTACGLSVFALTGALGLNCLSWGTPNAETETETETARIVKSANAFLATLTEDQRKKELYAFDDDRQRVRWSNFPGGFVPRGGLQLRAMTAPQREAVMTLLQTALSKRGYDKVQAIMHADDVFKRTDGARDESMFGSDLYSIAILGTPSETKPWMIMYGGHHLAINLTVVGTRGILTPTLTGAQPSAFTENGKTVRPLGAESDKGLALLNSLATPQRKQAILGYGVGDLMLGPGQDGRTIVPEGLKVSTMNAKQRALLLDLVAEWAGIVNDAAAKPRMREIEADLDKTWFAWSGPTTAKPGENIAAYYRVQGPRLVIEFAPQSMRGDDPRFHVHTMYRDPTNDYGRGHAER